jgi:hypothetical protein
MLAILGGRAGFHGADLGLFDVRARHTAVTLGSGDFTSAVPFAVVACYRAIAPLGPRTDGAILGACLLETRALLGKILGCRACDTAVSRRGKNPLGAFVVTSTALSGASVPLGPSGDIAIDGALGKNARCMLHMLCTSQAAKQGLLEDGPFAAVLAKAAGLRASFPFRPRIENTVDRAGLRVAVLGFDVIRRA